MLFVGLVVVFMAMIIFGIKEGKNRYDDENVLKICGCVFLAIVLVIWALLYVSNSIDIEKQRVFKDYNAKNYSISVTETKAILSEKAFKDFLVAGSIEKTQVGAGILKAITEWRDSVNQYNLNLASMRAIRANWFLGPMIMPKIPDDLTPLIINK